MTEELIELVKFTENCESSNRLNTRENAYILAKTLTSFITRNPQNKTKVKKYLRFVHNLAKNHSKTQCVNESNASTYLKHITAHKNEDLYLNYSDKCKEINTFYANQASTKSKLNERREFIKLQTQQSLPRDFMYNLLTTNDSEFAHFQLEITELKDESGKTVIQREADIKLAMAVFNLKENSSCIVSNMLSSLSRYDELLDCEKSFLKWLLSMKDYNIKELVDKFPFLLEEDLIEIATRYFQGNFEFDTDIDEFKWIQSDYEIKKRAFDIAQGLFSLAHWDLKLLNVLTKIIN